MNGEVLVIYLSAGGSKFSVVIADWLVSIADVSGLGFDGDVFLAVEFSRSFSLPLLFCSIGFQMAGNLNDLIEQTTLSQLKKTKKKKKNISWQPYGT